MSQATFVPVAREGVEVSAAGASRPAFRRGDFILTHGKSLTSSLIRFGQRLRIHGEDRKYTRWNHAALIVDDDGSLIEALGRGISSTHLSSYDDSEYLVVQIKASDHDRSQAVDFAKWAAGRGNPGARKKYGFVTIVSIAYTLLTGGKFTFGIDGRLICSGLVARAMERCGAIFSRNTTHIMPADLAKYYDEPGVP